MVDVDALATRAVAKLRGRVTAREARQVIAASLIVAVEQTVANAEAIVASRLVLAEVAADGRVLPTWLRRMLARNAADIGRRLKELSPKRGPDIDSGAPAGADLPSRRPIRPAPAPSSPAGG
jgi:hypothetical protein